MSLDALLEYHANAARQSVATAQPPALGRRPDATHRSRGYSVGLATLLVAAATATLGVSLLTDEHDSSADSTVDVAPTTTLLPVWPPVLDVVAPDGASWPCPSVNPKTDQILQPEEVPAEIRYLPPADAYEIDEAFGVNYGPACMRPPALVAVDFGEGDRSSIDSVVVVWVESPDAGTAPPDDPPLGPPVTNAGTEALTVTVNPDGFVVRHDPPADFVTERVDMVGTIDGLPVWIQSSGLSPETLSGLVELMSASPITGEVTISQQASSEGAFDVVRSGPVTAEVIENVVWFVDGAGFDIQIQRSPGFDPYASALGFTDSIVFVQIGGGVGMQSREGGGTGSVQWAIQPGVFARVESDGTFEELVSFAEQLLPATSTAQPSQDWLTSGEPITDEQFLALLGDGSSGGFPGYVPGTAIQLAWSPTYMESLQIGLFAVQHELAELGTGKLYCLTAYAALIGSSPNAYAGAMTCVDSVAEFERLISEFGFGAGGSCAGWLGNVAYVSGVPIAVDSVEFRLRDGTALIADVDEHGYALAAWDQDTPLIAVTYRGISAENMSLLDSFNLGDSRSCAEMSG